MLWEKFRANQPLLGNTNNSGKRIWYVLERPQQNLLLRSLPSSAGQGTCSAIPHAIFGGFVSSSKTKGTSLGIRLFLVQFPQEAGEFPLHGLILEHEEYVQAFPLMSGLSKSTLSSLGDWSLYNPPISVCVYMQVVTCNPLSAEDFHVPKLNFRSCIMMRLPRRAKCQG